METWQMKNHPVSNKQREMLQNLTLSSAFTKVEHQETMSWLDNPAATSDAASKLITRALARIKEKNAREKAAKARQEQARKERETKQQLDEAVDLLNATCKKTEQEALNQYDCFTH